MVERYQRINGDRELSLEEPIKTIEGKYIRPDVVDNKNHMIYDYKFYHTKISPAKLNMSPQMINYRETLKMPSKIVFPFKSIKHDIILFPYFKINF